MKFFVIILVLLASVSMWWFQAGVALRNCYIDHVEIQSDTNKYLGVLSSGLSDEKQIKMNGYVIDSYPECDEEVAQSYFVPPFGMDIIAQAAQKQ